MSHDLVLQTKIGREETLEKFLHTIGKKGTIKDPCAVRLRRVNREEFEARWAQKARALQIDANWIEPGLKLKNFKLFATDMDSTFLNLETLDEMASFVGKGEEVAHITELAMQGKIRNYAESLTARVKLMAGADASIVDRLIDRHIKPNPGAEKLVAAFKEAGIPMLLVSGGFSCVTEVVKERYGFTHVISNELEIVDGKLTGRVTELRLSTDAARFLMFQLMLCSMESSSPSSLPWATDPTTFPCLKLPDFLLHGTPSQRSDHTQNKLLILHLYPESSLCLTDQSSSTRLSILLTRLLRACNFFFDHSGR